MISKETIAWLRLSADAWTLGWQAARVVGLRSAKFAEGGPAAGMEAWLMLSEKWQTAFEVQADLLAKGSSKSPIATTRSAIAHYRRKVSANDRRLS